MDSIWGNICCEITVFPDINHESYLFFYAISVNWFRSADLNSIDGQSEKQPDERYRFFEMNLSVIVEYF